MAQQKTRLRPAIYTFRGVDGRPLYVGMSKASLGDRIRAHFVEGRAHALECTSIDVVWLPWSATEGDVLALEAQRIRALRPPANRAQNARGWDRAWEMRVQREHARAAGEPLSWWSGVVCWWSGVVWRCRRGARWVAGLVVVDVVIRVVWSAAT